MKQMHSVVTEIIDQTPQVTDAEDEVRIGVKIVALSIRGLDAQDSPLQNSRDVTIHNVCNTSMQ